MVGVRLARGCMCGACGACEVMHRLRDGTQTPAPACGKTGRALATMLRWAAQPHANHVCGRVRVRDNDVRDNDVRARVRAPALTHEAAGPQAAVVDLEDAGAVHCLAARSHGGAQLRRGAGGGVRGGTQCKGGGAHMET